VVLFTGVVLLPLGASKKAGGRSVQTAAVEGRSATRLDSAPRGNLNNWKSLNRAKGGKEQAGPGNSAVERRDALCFCSPPPGVVRFPQHAGIGRMALQAAALRSLLVCTVVTACEAESSSAFDSQTRRAVVRRAPRRSAPLLSILRSIQRAAEIGRNLQLPRMHEAAAIGGSTAAPARYQHRGIKSLEA
jgi:hypothetical protein